MQRYDETYGKGCILEVDVDYPKKPEKARSNLPFLPEN